jgi:tetratricopeptide (TPR) repeat protein
VLPVASPETFSRRQVRRLLGIRENRLTSWEQKGFIPALEVYAWQDLVALRSLQALRRDRVPAARIEQALAALRRKLAEVQNPLRELKLVAEGRHVVVLVDGQRMEPVSGQLLLDFGADEICRLLAFPGRQSPRERLVRGREAEFWFQKGLEMEQAGAPFEQIIQAYQRAVELDPTSVGALVNLGTVHYHRRDWHDAERCYQRALEVEPAYALAHFNLGNLCDELGNTERSRAHYEKAIALTPGYADAHYNLALLCQREGLAMKAMRHWEAYLKLDPASSWAAIARRELEKLRDAALVRGGGR